MQIPRLPFNDNFPPFYELKSVFRERYSKIALKSDYFSNKLFYLSFTTFPGNEVKSISLAYILRVAFSEEQNIVFK